MSSSSRIRLDVRPAVFLSKAFEVDSHGCSDAEDCAADIPQQSVEPRVPPSVCSQCVERAIAPPHQVEHDETRERPAVESKQREVDLELLQGGFPATR